MDRSVISGDDRKILEKILRCNFHPNNLNTDDIYEVFDRMKLAFWRPIHMDCNCTFCHDSASYQNTPAGMLACKVCMYDIQNKEIDILCPEEHPVSLKFRQIICN